MQGHTEGGGKGVGGGGLPGVSETPTDIYFNGKLRPVAMQTKHEYINLDMHYCSDRCREGVRREGTAPPNNCKIEIL